MYDEKPGWGKTIAAFFLCDFAAVSACAITSLMMAGSMGYSGYSNGGLMAAVAGIVCAAHYRSSGKLAGSVVTALVVGVILGFAAVQLSLSMAGR